MTRNVAALVATALLASGCIPSAHRRAKTLEGRYVVGEPGQGWGAVDPGGADRAWYNEGLGATIYTDSNCGTRFTGARTEDLATELAAGLHNSSLVFEETLGLDGRNGVLRTVTGTLDGIAVQVAFAVVNKDRCTYDLLYIAPPGRFDEGWPAYQAVLDGFETRR